jgi:hypothetical protein
VAAVDILAAAHGLRPVGAITDRLGRPHSGARASSYAVDDVRRFSDTYLHPP